MARFCTECGKEIPEGSAFCTECGAKAEATMENTVSENTVSENVTPVKAAPNNARAEMTPPPYTPPQQQYQAPVQPGYGAGAPPLAKSKYDPITTGGYIGIMLLMCIPFLGIILTIIWACGGCRKINKRNLARASLIMMVIALILSLIIGFAAKTFIKNLTNSIQKEMGISISQEDEQDKSGGLGGLLGLFGGGDDTDKGGYGDITNSDIESLGELKNLLKGIGIGEESGLDNLISEGQKINQEAEAKNSGWPKSLRKYPGGTATAVTSYRTQIEGTTAEEMMAWIDELRGDGFQYQDFYDFGLSEEDMLNVNGWWATDGEIYISLSFNEGTLLVDHTKELPDMSGIFGD